jgi:precorrin isomerase
VSDYTDGLKRAVEILEVSNGADELEMSDQPLDEYVRAIIEAKQLILDDIEMISASSVNDERIAELEQALKDIKKHQELVSGQMGTTWHIADIALNK